MTNEQQTIQIETKKSDRAASNPKASKRFKRFIITPERPSEGVAIARNRCLCFNHSERLNYYPTVGVDIEKGKLFGGQPAFIQSHFQAIEQGPKKIRESDKTTYEGVKELKETKMRGRGYAIPPSWVIAHAALQDPSFFDTEMTSTVIAFPDDWQADYSYVIHGVNPRFLSHKMPFEADPSTDIENPGDLMLILPKRYDLTSREGNPFCNKSGGKRIYLVQEFIEQFPDMASALFLMGRKSLEQLVDQMPENAVFEYSDESIAPRGVTFNFKPSRTLNDWRYKGASPDGGILLQPVGPYLNAIKNPARAMKYPLIKTKHLK
ncbi:MAG: hypothetical protein KJ600_00460 [Nanoarchaeota archaeon]|nr:hypothetical protein [Nanoarchaeota archaeon]MBU1103015.1 hypothetical protein [Nanoarchaeota archaeon]